MTLKVPARQAREGLTQLLDAVEEEQDHVVITRWGSPSAVLVSNTWHDRASRALAVLEGLAALAQGGGGDVQQFLATLTAPQEVAKAS